MQKQRKVTTCFKYITVVFLLLNFPVFSQITHGKITYERKTNLHKKFKGESKDWIKNSDKTKIDMFELYFNDSISAFALEESDLKEKMSWATNKNSVYQNSKTNKRLTIMSIWGEEFFLSDSLRFRQWKITESKRNICGYSCRKALWQANDTTRIYAWYCDEISVSVGPESFVGLPGAILGLATEDGGVVYFAKKIETTEQALEKIVSKKTKSKIYKTSELKETLEKQFGKKPWAKEELNNIFGIW